MQTVVMAIFDIVMLLLKIAGFFLIVLYCIKWGIEEFSKEEEKKKERFRVAIRFYLTEKYDIHISDPELDELIELMYRKEH